MTILKLGAEAVAESEMECGKTKNENLIVKVIVG